MAGDFSVDNICLLIQAAREGGSRRIIIERAGIGVPLTKLNNWILRGQRDRKKGVESAYFKFIELWDANHPSEEVRRGNDRMAIIDAAIQRLYEADTFNAG